MNAETADRGRGRTVRPECRIQPGCHPRHLDLFCRLLVPLLLVATGGPPPNALALHPENLYGQRTVSLDDLSPDGRYLIYSLHTFDRDAGATRTTTLRRDLDDGQEIVLFSPEDRCAGPVWSPDGEIIAYRKRLDCGEELWLMRADGAQRRRLGDTCAAASVLVWAPDGSALAVITTQTVDDYDGRSGEYVVADFIGYRHLKAGYREGSLRQLSLCDVATGKQQRLVDAAIDVRNVAWSPDATRLVFAGKRREDLGVNLNSDLWIVDRAGGTPRQLTFNPGPDTKPRWLADGRISYLRSEDPLWEAQPVTIARIAADAGDRGPVLESATRFDDFFWRYAPAGDEFVFLGANAGTLDLYRTTGDTQQRLTSAGCDFWDLRVAGDRVVLSGTDMQTPSALYLFEFGADDRSGSFETLADPNVDWCDKVALIRAETFAIEVEGRTIHGWYLLPDELAPGQMAPTVLSIHGGPEWMYGGYFLPEFHILPTYGYAVLIANPTGSMGYGTEFMRDIRGDWTGRPARELTACLDWAVAQGWADPSRLAVMGGSYGGHLAAALTTQSDRFRAAAVDRMYPELVSFWGTTDEKWFPEWEFKGRPWEAADVYARNSPFTFVDRVTTPTLISQGMQDYRCLIAGGECWFSALQALGVPTRFIRFENEGHGIRGRDNQVFYYDQLLAWFDRYVLTEHDDTADDDATEYDSGETDTHE